MLRLWRKGSSRTFTCPRVSTRCEHFDAFNTHSIGQTAGVEAEIPSKQWKDTVMSTRMELLLAVKRYIYMDVHLEFLQNLRDLLLNYGIKRVRSTSITINSGYPLKQVRFKLVDSYACFDFCPLMVCFVGQLMSNTCTLVGIFPLMPYIAKCRSSVDTLNTMSTCHDIWPILSSLALCYTTYARMCTCTLSHSCKA